MHSPVWTDLPSRQWLNTWQAVKGYLGWKGDEASTHCPIAAASMKYDGWGPQYYIVTALFPADSLLEIKSNSHLQILFCTPAIQSKPHYFSIQETKKLCKMRYKLLPESQRITGWRRPTEVCSPTPCQSRPISGVQGLSLYSFEYLQGQRSLNFPGHLFKFQTTSFRSKKTLSLNYTGIYQVLVCVLYHSNYHHAPFRNHVFPSSLYPLIT